MNAEYPVLAPTGELAPQEVVLRFLESTGRPSEARLYLSLFRARPREQFAAIAIDANVMADAAEAVVQDLKFLAALELFPTVVLGVFQPEGARGHARQLAKNLENERVTAETLPASAADLAVCLTQSAARGCVPIIYFEPEPSGEAGTRLNLLGDVLKELHARKLLFLHRPGGLRQRGVLVPIVNLTTDAPALLASRELSRKEALMLEHAAWLCETAPGPLTVAVTSPFNLLRELFTVKGAGTLLRRGARILHHDGWNGTEMERLRELLTSSFGRAPAESFFERSPSHIYLEENYRGCIILLDSPLGAYLTKFAVSAEAQGEGIARDLWESLMADTPCVFWRARRSNPISEWYVKLCDGLVRLPGWTVYWKGLAHESIAAVIDWATSQPVDIPRDE